MPYLPFILVLILCLGGCNKFSKSSRERTMEIVSCHTGKEFSCEEATHSLLDEELTAESVVQIALFNNPSLQAAMEEIGIARADLLEASLLTNPLFDSFFRYPNIHGQHLNTEYNITTSLLDAFLIPLKRRVALLNLKEAEVLAADKALRLIADVQVAFYRLQAEEKKTVFLEQISEIVSIEREIAERQLRQGNVQQYFLDGYVLDAEQAEYDLIRSYLEVSQRREELTTLLGLCGEISTLRPALNFPPLPEEEVPLCDVERLGLENRLDLESARIDVIKIARMGALKQWWTYTDAVGGLSIEHDTDGGYVSGPIVTLQIPIFNFGQADRQRLLAQFRQSQKNYLAVLVNVLSEIRQARDSVVINRDLVEKFQTGIIPARENLTKDALELYNVMNLGVYQLLEEKRKLLESQLDLVMAQRDYWISRVRLDYAIGR